MISNNKLAAIWCPCVLFIFLMINPGTAQSQNNGLDTLQLKTIFDEPFLPGTRPGIIDFNGTGSHIYFNWNDSSYAETGVYRVDIEGVLTEPYRDEPYYRGTLSPDESKLVFTDDGDIWVSDQRGREARIIFGGKDHNYSPVWSPDSRSVAFVHQGDVWISNIETGSTRQVTRRDSNDPAFTIDAWLINNHMILRQTDRSHFREVYFPEYVPKFVNPGASRRGQPHTTLFLFEPDNGEKEVILEGDYYILNTDSSHDFRYFLMDYTDHEMKNRTIESIDIIDKEQTVLFSESTEGWIYPPLMRAAFSPGTDMLFFTSEESGWSQIYVIRADGSRLSRITSGAHEVDWADWVNDDTIVYASSERDSGLRDVYAVNINSTDTNRLTQSNAYRYNFRMSPNRRYIAYKRTYWNEPGEIYIMDLRRPREESRLTNTIPDRFHDVDWQQPEYIKFTSRDEDTELTMDVLLPHDFDPDQTYPVVVFVHGAGSLQNVFQGWSISYWREYMFHQYLNREGYVVVEVDYRHSTGYGRKFREDVTNWMGRYELKDIVDGLEFLNRQHGYLDMDNIGIYGGSYGGFMALYALSHEPEYFKAGAALRAVTDWVNYFYANPGYTRPRLGHPDDDPEHYERSSPISYADTLSRPVIILHGLIDDNVGFQDAAQYIDRLVESGNTNFETMFYPSERHAYQSPNAWYDQYLRIFNFFELHLKEEE